METDIEVERALDADLVAAMADVMVDKPVIPSYGQFKALRRAGGKLSRFNIRMHLAVRDKQGQLQSCREINLPAEKTLKYPSMDMHFVDGPPHVQPPPGEPEMTPDRTMAATVARAVAEVVGKGGQPADSYHCQVEGCSRFFDSANGRDFHARTAHKKASPTASNRRGRTPRASP